MGVCLSCFKGKSQENVEVELSSTTNHCMCKPGKCSSKMEISSSAKDVGAFHIAGSGTVLGSCGLDCDTGYWEVRLGENPMSVKIGVKRYSKNAGINLDEELVAKEGDSWFMDTLGLSLKSGDVIGVYWDQTDLPMLSFYLNGEVLPKTAINRVRPATDIYPAVSISSGSNCSVIFDAAGFTYPPKSKKFTMIVCATQLI